jgi:hypothetical protein
MKVLLDGQQYTLKAGTGVNRVALTEYSDNVRLTGQQTRADRALLSSAVFDRWDGGLGIKQRNYADQSTMNRIWDVNNMDTRWSSLFISPQFIVATVNPPLDVSIPVQWRNNLYFFERGLLATKPYMAGMAYQYTGSNVIASFSAIAGTLETIWYRDLQAAQAFGNHIALCFRRMDNNQTYISMIPTLGGTISADVKMLTANTPSLAPQIGNYGGTVHVIAHDPVTGLVTMAIGNHDVASFSGVATLPQTVGSYLAPLVTDGLTMWASLEDGVYEFDTVPHKVIDTSQSRDKNPWQTNFRNNLYFKNNYSLIGYDGANLAPVGYDRDDGLVNTKWGQITAGVSSQKFIFAAVKGATYSQILTYDGAAWQFYAQIPSPGLIVREMFLSNLPDGIDKLWCTFTVGTFNPGYFINPLTRPDTAGTYSHATAIGSVELSDVFFPWDDGGIPEEQAGYYKLTVTGGSINSSHIPVRVAVGFNGGWPGDVIGTAASDSTTLNICDPYGTYGYRIQVRLLPYNGSNLGGTPEIRSVIVNYLKIPDPRESFDFTIDLDETAVAEVKPLEAVIGSLNYVRSKRTLSPFFYGMMATKNVRILEQPSAEDVDKEDYFMGERGGFVRVRCAEII